MSTATLKPPTDSTRSFVPREHGATAMLLAPFFSAAILLRQVSWQELVALVSILCALVIKDPLVVIARQRLVWKQEHPETRAAIRSATRQLVVLGACGLALVLTRDWRPWIFLFLGTTGFTVVAVMVNVRNRQRSEWFQVASAAALTSTCLAACLSVREGIPGWCWLLWSLSALQATAGIFVVHARLDARVAARKSTVQNDGNRRAAFVCQAILVLTAVGFGYLGRLWIGAALLILAAGYLFDLKRQKDPTSLQTPLTRVGQQALALSIIYSLMIVAGLW